MEFAYKFPAVKGMQAKKEYYIAMVPLKYLPKIFQFNDVDFVQPEHRSQRKINERRIPEITGYILNNRDTYVFSALSASIDGDFSFISISDETNLGILEVDMSATFLINDGQHRKAAIDEAIKENPLLK
jgi:DNA sulfur modification protein DndB